MDGPASTQMEWLDTAGQRWRVELSPQRIVLRGDAAVIELPRERWGQDLFVTPQGESYLVRVETFAASAQFVLSPGTGQFFTQHLGETGPRPAGSEQLPEPVDAPGDERSTPLLWPRVSSLAVAAVAVSSLVFLPVIGVIPAVVVVVLLGLHRRRVRRAAAWRHSRRLCHAAAVWLICGVVVNVLATLAISRAVSPTRERVVLSPAIRAPATNAGVIAAVVAVVLLALTVHEAAHAVTAWWLGDGMARSMGRVTLNPLAHIDPFGTILLPALLLWVGGPMFGYARPVPVQVDMLPRRSRAHVLISAAGPASNLLMAAGSLMLLVGIGSALRLWGGGAEVSNLANPGWGSVVRISGFAGAPMVAAGCTLLKAAFVINVVLALFNLIPIPPLDGSWVLEHLFPRTLGRIYQVLRPYGMLVFVAAVYAHVFDYGMRPVAHVLGLGFRLLHTTSGAW